MKQLFLLPKLLTVLITVGVLIPTTPVNAQKAKTENVVGSLLHHPEVSLAKVRYKKMTVNIPSDIVKRCPKQEGEIKKHKLPVKIFSYIMWRESRCQEKVIGWNYRKGMSHRDCRLSPVNTYKKCSAVKSYDSGLLQINSSWVTLTKETCGGKWGDMSILLNQECNLAVASKILQDGGLSNWGF